MKKLSLSMIALTYFVGSTAQVTIERGAIVHLQDKATLTVQGDLHTWNDIDGNGFIQLTGNRTVYIDAHGFRISNLVILSPAILKSDLGITSRLVMESGNLQLRDHNVMLYENALIGGSEKSYAETTGSGAVVKAVADKLDHFFIPVGTSRSYLPVEFNGNAAKKYGRLEVVARGKLNSHKPSGTDNFLNAYWTIRLEGSIQDMTVSGYYKMQDVHGNASALSSYLWDGFSWKRQLSGTDQKGKITAKVPAGAGELFAMNDVMQFLTNSIKLLNNPAKSFTVLQVNVTENKSYHLAIRDVTGRLLQQQDIKAAKGTNYHTIYLNGLTKGVYFLEVTNENDKKSFKFLKAD